LKLLIVKLHALGDLVIATPAIRRLREGLPDAVIELLTTKWSAPAVVHNQLIDRLIIIPNDIFFRPSYSTFIPTLTLINNIKRQSYDAAVLFHSNKFIDWFISLTGISQRFKFVNRRLMISSQNSTINDGIMTVQLDQDRHSALTAWELADLTVRGLAGKKVLPPDIEELRYEWFIQDLERDEARNIITNAGLRCGNFVILMPGGGVNPRDKDEVRRWGVEKYAELANIIHTRIKMPIVLLGGSSDEQVCRSVADIANKKYNIPVEQMDHHNFNIHNDSDQNDTGRLCILNWCDHFDIRISASIMSVSRLVVVNDTGPLHIAGAIGIPVVGIFGPTGQSLKLPPGDNVYSVNLGLPCSPCYFSSFKGCIFEEIRCMEELSADDVMKVIDIALVESGQPESK